MPKGQLIIERTKNKMKQFHFKSIKIIRSKANINQPRLHE